MAMASMLHFNQSYPLVATSTNCRLFVAGEVTKTAVAKKQVDYICRGSQSRKFIICANNDNSYKKDGLSFGETHKLTTKKYGIAAFASQSEHEQLNSRDVDVGTNFKWSSITDNVLITLIRPVVSIGNILKVISITIVAVDTISDLSPKLLIGMLKATLSLFFMDIYTITLNQLTDIKEDKINKAHLPIASGELSMEIGIAIAVGSALLSIWMGILQSPPLLAALLVQFTCAIAYSLKVPLLRWKQNTFLSILVNVITISVCYQIGIFLHIKNYILAKPTSNIPRSLVFSIIVSSLICISISVCKDIPDIEGDREAGTQTFCIIHGVENTFRFGVRLITLACGVGVVAGAFSSSPLNKLITMLGHCTLALVLWIRAQSIDIIDKRSSMDFYVLHWKLLYATYILAPFMG